MVSRGREGGRGGPMSPTFLPFGPVQALHTAIVWLTQFKTYLTRSSLKSKVEPTIRRRDSYSNRVHIDWPSFLTRRLQDNNRFTTDNRLANHALTQQAPRHSYNKAIPCFVLWRNIYSPSMFRNSTQQTSQ